MGWAKPHGTSLHRGEGGGTGGSLTQPQWEICLSSARQPGRAIKCSLDATRCRLVSPSGCLGLGAQRPHCFSPRCAWEYSWMGRGFFFPQRNVTASLWPFGPCESLLSLEVPRFALRRGTDLCQCSFAKPGALAFP